MSYATCCILSYNRPAFLRTAISSLRENAGAPLELIVHDDGSIDLDVRRYLNELCHEGVISTLIMNPAGHNQGQGTALNRMFGMATGDPIIKLDQDLIFQPNWLGQINEILAHNSGEHAPFGDEPDIGLLGMFHYRADPVDSPKCKIADHDGWEEHTHICGSSFAVTRDCWQALGPFSEHSAAFAEDWEFQQRVTNSEDYVCGLPPLGTDLVVNQGFGVGPSTVVVDHGKVARIHEGPVVHA